MADKKDINTKLINAAIDGDTDTVKILLGGGADVNVRSTFGGVTPLMIAAMNGRTATVKALLENGADVHATDDWGKTAMSAAKMAGKAEIAEILKRHGATE